MTEKDRIWTVPNVLSLLRLFMLIPILICLANEKRVWALSWMLLGVATDFLDGYIARRWNQRSNFGRMIDPFIDKVNVVVVTLYMALSPLYQFPLWFFLFICIRELTLMFFSLRVIRKRNIVIESNRPGKNSAFATGMVVIFFVMGWQPFGWIMLWIAFILTLYSSWVYLRLFIQQVRQISPSGF